MREIERLLPKEIIARASVRGDEHAWSVADIPIVIDAAKAANLINIGGQLQLRIPDGKTCECHWVEVDTHKEVESNLPWVERVAASAISAHSQFQTLCRDVDFLAEVRDAFAPHLDEVKMRDGDLSEALCFVWYFEGHESGEATDD